MSFVKLGKMAGGAAFRGGSKFAGLGSTGRLLAMGAGGGVAGGVYGASQGYDTNSRIEGFAKGFVGGSMAGLAGGAALHPTAWKMGGRAAGSAAGFAWKNRMPHHAASGALKAGRWAFENPGKIMAGAGLLYGGAKLNEAAVGQLPSTSPTLDGVKVNTSYNQQMIAAAQMGQIGTGTTGTAPQMYPSFQREAYKSARRMSPDTTSGLVQGLHRSRHK